MTLGASSTFGGKLTGLPPSVLDKTFSVGTSSVLVLEANPRRIWASFVNDSNFVIYLQIGANAANNTGIRLNANGGSFIIDKNTPWDGQVFAIAGAAASVLCIVECEAEFR